MFRRLSEALPLSEASMLALRPALNAPVLNVGFLPVGPARAAIVVFAEEWGGIGFALGIRSNEGGQVAVFRNQVSIEPDVAIPDVLEPVLAEAEQMGFLFDEDMVAGQPGGAGREQAMALWGRLMGEIEMPPAPKAAPAEPAATEPIRDLPDRPAPILSPTELVLEDVAALDLTEISLELEANALSPGGLDERRSRRDRRVPPARQEVTAATEPLLEVDPAVAKTPALPARKTPKPVEPPKLKLSKFRHVDDQVEALSHGEIDGTEMIDGGSELGRIPIVRIRRERDGNKRIPYLARLLSSF